MNGTLLAVLAAALAAACVLAEEPAAPLGKTKLVLDFEDAKNWMSENDSPFETSPEHVTQGKAALKVHYTNKPEWSNVLTSTFPGDWSGFRYLNFDLYLEGKMPAAFGMWIKDKSQHKAEASFQLGPGPNTLTVDLDELKRTGELDRAAVTALCLYKGCAEEITVYLDNMYLSENKPVIPEAVPVQMPAAELLSNGGFEETQKPGDFGNPFAWWQGRRQSGASYLGAGTSAVFSGRASAMLDGRAPCDIAYFSPPVEVQYPTKLKLTAYIAAQDLGKGFNGHAGSISVTDVGDRLLPNALVPVPVGTYGWKKVELVCAVPNKTPFVKVFLRLNGRGRLWIDDVSLTGIDLNAKPGANLSDAGRELHADPPLVTETEAQLKLRAKAREAMRQLKETAEEAKAKSVETLYDEIPLVLGNLAFDVRWDIPEHAALREGYAAFVLERCTAARKHLQRVMAGKEPDLKVPPHPDFSKLKLKGRYYCEGDEPKILFSMQYHHKGELTRWFCPEGYEGSIAAVGANRYDFQQMPIWEAYQKYPETHRVYDDGWCGHIIRDKYSDGGTDRCVISLDSPKMLEAIAKSIEIYAGRAKPRAPLFFNMGFEYSYVNYDAVSADKFRAWLERKYQSIDGLNAVWKTGLKSFAEIAPPSYDPNKPEANPAKYYDWGDFNLWRFTAFMQWAQAEIRKHIPGAITTTGGGEPFGAGFWRQGIDEEGLAVSGVNGIYLSETGSRALGVTSVMDLQRHLVSAPRLILDPEYHALANTCFLMFLHGCGVMDYWWWPDEAEGFYDSSMKHSHTRTLLEVEKVLQDALDVRRLAKYIAPFPDAPAPIGLLYSRASLIQKFPGAQGNKTPYSLEVEKSYEAAVRLDAPTGFVTSSQATAGIPENFKVLVVPGCRYMEEAVFERLLAWTRAGGTLVITPTSLVADEYNRRRDYLKNLGIEVLSEELPEFMAGEAKRGIEQTGELDFIQGPVVKTQVAKESKRRVRPNYSALFDKDTRELEAAGVIQLVRPSSDWKVLASYVDDGAPAILSRTLGKGSICYLAAQLSVDSRRVLFDRLLGEAGAPRPVRAFSAQGGYPEGVESRTVLFEGQWLTYLVNTNKEPVKIKLSAERGIGAIFNLNSATRASSATLTLEPYESAIYKIQPKD
ncbi:MAG: beta-galactosidase trimerization domain-containing protein [Planctomycetes bacterium]|nr:beta-galactosidase trimerization domain-containing protein [Planctomycetota bacterium]